VEDDKFRVFINRILYLFRICVYIILFYLEKNIYIGKNHDEVQILRNAVHPKLGLHIFNCAFKEKQKTL